MPSSLVGVDECMIKNCVVVADGGGGARVGVGPAAVGARRGPQDDLRRRHHSAAGAAGRGLRHRGALAQGGTAAGHRHETAQAVDGVGRRAGGRASVAAQADRRRQRQRKSSERQSAAQALPPEAAVTNDPPETSGAAVQDTEHRATVEADPGTRGDHPSPIEAAARPRRPDRPPGGSEAPDEDGALRVQLPPRDVSKGYLPRR